MCRSRRELSNEYLLEKIGFDTAENEPECGYGISLLFVSLIFGPGHEAGVVRRPHRGGRRDLEERDDAGHLRCSVLDKSRLEAEGLRFSASLPAY